MGKGGRFPGGMGGNMSNMLKQAQKMQQDIAKMQAELETREVEASTGGGAVKAVVSGKKEVISISINPEVVDADDVEMLEDLVLTCINEALKKADEMVNSEMAKITGGMGMPF